MPKEVATNNFDNEVIDEYCTIVIFAQHDNYKGRGNTKVMITIDCFGQQKSTGDIT